MREAPDAQLQAALGSRRGPAAGVSRGSSGSGGGGSFAAADARTAALPAATSLTADDEERMLQVTGLKGTGRGFWGFVRPYLTCTCQLPHPCTSGQASHLHVCWLCAPRALPLPRPPTPSHPTPLCPPLQLAIQASLLDSSGAVASGPAPAAGPQERASSVACGAGHILPRTAEEEEELIRRALEESMQVRGVVVKAT
jgi:hypothetical protein